MIKKENWEKIVQQFQVSWPQVSDLKYWKSPVAKDYFVQELPFNVIIDGDGKVMATNLHGTELKDFLAKHLQ